MLLGEAERIEPAKGSKVTRGLRLHHGSDIEISQVLLEKLEDVYGPIVTADASLWFFNQTHFANLGGAVLDQHIHSADGRPYLTPAGEPAVVKLSTPRVRSIKDSMVTYRQQPKFFVDTSAKTPPAIPCASGVVVFDPVTGEYQLEDHARRHRNRHILPGRFLERQHAMLQEIEAGSTKAAQQFAETLLGHLIIGCFLEDEDADAKAHLLQEVMGIVAAGWATRMRSPRAIIALGEKAGNGKSQFSSLLRGLVPAANRCSVSPADFANEYYAFKLIGALLNAVDELPERAIVGDRFKAAITGDTMPARQIYQAAGEVSPQALNWLTSNQLPRFASGVDAGVLRRLLFIRFDRVIPERERIPWLGARIAEEEQDLLLCYAVLGLSRFLKNQDYTIPKSSHAVTRQFAEESDSVRGWLAQRTTYDSADLTARTWAEEAYADYRSWASEQGIQPQYIVALPVFGKRISRALPELPPEDKRKSDGRRYYPGLTLRPVTVPSGEFS
jgi:phage/plasmid-associated DNA primase